MTNEPSAHTQWRLQAAICAAKAYKDALMLDPRQNAPDHRRAVAAGDMWLRHAHDEVNVPLRGHRPMLAAVVAVLTVAVLAGLAGFVLGGLT